MEPSIEALQETADSGTGFLRLDARGYGLPGAEDSGRGGIPGIPGIPGLAAEVRDLLADVASLDDTELLVATAEVEQLSRVVEAAQVRLAHRVRELCATVLLEDSLAHKLGCRNEVEVLQRVTRAQARVLTRRLRVANAVTPRQSLSGEQLPPKAAVVAEAFHAGDLSLESAERISAMLARSAHVASYEALDAAERSLVETAVGTAAAAGSAAGSVGTLPSHDDDVRVHCEVWGAFLDQDGPEPEETCPEEKRGLRFGKARNGIVPVSGGLLPETAALLARLIDAANAPQVRKRVRFEPTPGNAQAADRHGAGEQSAGGHGAGEQSAGVQSTGGHGSGEQDVLPDAALLVDAPNIDGRSPDQLRHDALATVLQMVARHPDVPLLGGAPVAVLVQVTQKNLDQEAGVGWVHGHDGQIAPVPLSSVRQASCSGETMRVTQDEHGRIVHLNTTSRVFNAKQRRAITVRDGGCIIPGCTIPAAWCEIHHVTEWAAGGETHTDNGVLLCWYHHRSLDKTQWEIRMQGGVPQVRPPGWVDPRRGWYRTGSVLRVPGSGPGGSWGNPPGATPEHPPGNSGNSGNSGNPKYRAAA